MATSVIFEETVEIPFVRSLADFRAWALSDQFPERGRIDYLAGHIEVDMSPEDFFCHGTLKVELVGTLNEMVKRGGSGYLVSDRTRISSPDADLSVEPDIVFISQDALDEGRVRLVAKSGGEPDRFVEVEGGPDLIVEIVSDASVAKDTRRLPAAYARAGVREFWLIDARREQLLFQIYHLEAGGYVPAPVDADGFQLSRVMGVPFRLRRQRNPHGRWTFDLQRRE